MNRKQPSVQAFRLSKLPTGRSSNRAATCTSLGHPPLGQVRSCAPAAPSGRFPAVVLCAVFLIATAPLHAQDEKVTYEDHVKPIFRQRCLTCHNTNERNADLDLSNYTAMMQGGASGPVIEPGDSGASYLYALVSHSEEPAMPPDSDPIPDPELQMIQQWIDNGALENKGSKFVPKKKKVNLAIAASATERPEHIAIPGRISKAPVIHTTRSDACATLATSPWAPLCAIAGQQQILLYNTQTLELQGVLPFPEGQANILKFSRNGSLLLAGGGHDAATGKVVVFDVASGNRVIQVGDELDAVLAADISFDHQLIALGGPQRMVRVYSTETGELVYEIKKHTDWVYAVAFSPDGVLLATADRNGGLHVWEALTGRDYLTLNGHTAAITGMSWRIDSNVLATCSEDTTVRLWEMENGGQIKNWGAHGGGAQSIEFARDGRLVTCGRDRTAKLWDQNGSQLQAFPAFNDIALATSICDETNRVIAGDWTGDIRVWEAADGAQVGTFTANPLPLEDRLQQARQQLVAQQAALAPLASTLQSAQQDLTQLQSKIQADEQTKQDLTKQLEQLKSQAVAAQNGQTQLQQQAEQIKAVITTLNAAIPPLTQATDQLKVAANQLQDEATQQLVISTEQLLKDKVQALQTQQGQLGEVNQQIEQLNMKQTQFATDQQTTETQLAEVTQRLQQLVPQAEPAQQAVQEAKAKHDAIAATVVTAEQAVAKWQNEIEFAKQIKELKDRLAAAEAKRLELQQLEFEASEILNQLKSELAGKTTKLAEMQTSLATISQQYAEQESAVSVQRDTLNKQQSGLQQTEQQLSRILTSIQALTPVAQAAVEASKVAPDDAEIQSAAQQLTALVAQREKMSADLQTQLNTQRVQVESTNQQLADSEKQLTDLGAQVEARRQEVESTEAGLIPAKDNVAQQEMRLAELQKSAEASATTIQSIEQEIAVAQGLADDAAGAPAE